MHSRMFVGKESTIRAIMAAIDSFDFPNEAEEVIYQSYFYGFLFTKGVLMITSRDYNSIMTIQGFCNRLTGKD